MLLELASEHHKLPVFPAPSCWCPVLSATPIAKDVSHCSCSALGFQWELAYLKHRDSLHNFFASSLVDYCDISSGKLLVGAEDDSCLFSWPSLGLGHMLCTGS